MSRKQIIVLVSAIILVSVIVWYFFFKKPKTETPIVDTKSPAPDTMAFSVNDNFPLQIGSKGDKVKQLQTAINKIDSRSTLVVDGVFGKVTKDSLQAFLGGSYYPVTEDKFKYIIDFSKQI